MLDFIVSYTAKIGRFKQVTIKSTLAVQLHKILNYKRLPITHLNRQVLYISFYSFLFLMDG